MIISVTLGCYSYKHGARILFYTLIDHRQKYEYKSDQVFGITEDDATYYGCTEVDAESLWLKIIGKSPEVGFHLDLNLILQALTPKNP